MNRSAGKIAISDTNDYFVSDGKPFFYLADTVWSAFQGPTFEEWEQYLDYRSAQGFNVLQINILYQCDAVARMRPDTAPFETRQDGTYDFHRINRRYFERAERLLQMAAERGFVPALVLLWANFVPGTWRTTRQPGTEMPMDAIQPYLQCVAEHFSPFDPIYLVSGDTDLRSDEAVEVYKHALDAIKKLQPSALTAMHIWGDSADLPEVIRNSQNLDFYMYQSGHKFDRQHRAYEFAGQFYHQPRTRPIVNGEPCYEGLGRKQWHQRFSAFDVRKATWQSLLSGASAGVAYGAQGIWSWHRRGAGTPMGEVLGGMCPFLWNIALHFEGAWDAGTTRWLFEQFQLFGIQPQQEKVLNDTTEIRLALSPDGSRLAMYVPYSMDVRVQLDLASYDLTLINLSTRAFACPDIESDDDATVLKQHPFNSDVLLLGKKASN